MSVGHQLKYLKKFPIHILVRKAVNGLKKKLFRNQITSKYRTNDVRTTSLIIPITKLIPLPPVSLQINHILTEQWCNHVFDILGSGPIQNSYLSKPHDVNQNRYHHTVIITTPDKKGDWLNHVVHASHLEYSKRIWEKILQFQSNYKPIDWQMDVKSGFRWNAQESGHIQHKLSSNSPGSDIKVPWELSRLQHLPPLLLAAKKDESKLQEDVLIESLCQCLDFIMANPVGMGVNFNCPMDIGIRNANLLIYLDWLKQLNTGILSSDIENIITTYVATSTEYILENLEYREGLTSNHYLGNILGVLFAGAYLPAHPTSDSWLIFGLQEVASCMERQFFDDGTNFEGSTSYHRLSGEMMAWASLITLHLSKSRLEAIDLTSNGKWEHRPSIKRNSIHWIKENQYIFPEGFWKKLKRSAHFSDIISKPNGDVCQFGDNDSGRFVKLTLVGNTLDLNQAKSKYLNLSHLSDSNSAIFYDENVLNHGAFISSVYGLQNNKPTNKHYCEVEHTIFQQASKKHSNFTEYINGLPSYKSPLISADDTRVVLSNKIEKKIDFPAPIYNTLPDLQPYYFEDFQLVVIKNNTFYIALAGISNPNQHHSLGHTHNDKLAIELQVHEQELLYNPGTYVYTADPLSRYLFRSVKSHNTISVNNQEQNTPLPGNFGLFNLKKETKFRLVKLTPNEVIAEIKYRDIHHIRRISIAQSHILVEDSCNKPFSQHWNTGQPYSNGYGQRIA